MPSTTKPFSESKAKLEPDFDDIFKDLKAPKALNTLWEGHNDDPFASNSNNFDDAFNPNFDPVPEKKMTSHKVISTAATFSKSVKSDSTTTSSPSIAVKSSSVASPDDFKADFGAAFSSIPTTGLATVSANNHVSTDIDSFDAKFPDINDLDFKSPSTKPTDTKASNPASEMTLEQAKKQAL